MSGEPIISVAMGLKYSDSDISALRRSVNSILTQSRVDIEFLICAKESSENAAAFLSETAEADSRVIILDGEGCCHLGGQLNRCIEKARGKFIARMDDDDYSCPERLGIQLDFLTERGELAFVGSNVRLIRGGKDEGTRELPEEPQVRDFLFVQPFIHPTLMFRKSALKAVGGYSDEKHRRGCEDYDLLLRLYGKGFRGANIQRCLLDYTLPENEKSHRSFRLRINESRTRFSLYSGLGLMPGALPYAVKPVAVGLLPGGLLKKLKKKKYGSGS